MTEPYKPTTKDWFTRQPAERRSRKMSTTVVTRIPPPANAELAGPDKQNELNTTQRRKLLKAAELLEAGMPWDDTAEGLEFWSAVHERLRNIAGGEALK
jgi:hypothetical protein